MGERIEWTTQADVEKIWIFEGDEYSHRLVTKQRQGCESFSFHITTYTPHFDTIVEGDGIHEVVLYCLQGDSVQTVLEDGRERHFTPGTAIYLPLNFAYRHVIGPNGLVVAVACTPPRE